MTLFAEEGGRGPDLLVLLHGLGATGAVWQPLLELIGTHASTDAQVLQHRWRGRWLTLDLPGHGRSAPLAHYAIPDIAESIARSVVSRADPAGRLVILGHSLGGAIALALASGARAVRPERVFGVGIKVDWSEADLQRLGAIATQPRRRFATEQEAWERYLKVCGLHGLVAAGSPVLARGIVRESEGWCLAMDPAANAVGRPPFAQMIAAARCPVHLARGREDALVTLDQLRSLVPSATDLDARGHNVMVDAPAVLWEWLAARN
jgi:pimeloyl-ACP methyl ester carboxylesterase